MDGAERADGVRWVAAGLGWGRKERGKACGVASKKEVTRIGAALVMQGGWGEGGGGVIVILAR